MASRADTDLAAAADTLVPVWDWLVRIGHWTMVAGFFMAYFTEDDLLTLHVWAGYVVGVLLFSGTLYAMALGAPRWLGAVTPLGGLSLIVAWLAVAVAALRRPADDDPA